MAVQSQNLPTNPRPPTTSPQQPVASSVQSRPTNATRYVGPNRYHVGAVVTQIGSFLTTYAFFAAVMHGSAWYAALGVALAVEFVLLLGKSLRNRANQVTVSGASIIFDTLLNAGGVWPWLRNIAASPPALMIVEAFQLDRQVGLIPAFVLSLLIGYLLAVAPHRLWRAAQTE